MLSGHYPPYSSEAVRAAIYADASIGSRETEGFWLLWQRHMGGIIALQRQRASKWKTAPVLGLGMAQVSQNGVTPFFVELLWANALYYSVFSICSATGTPNQVLSRLVVSTAIMPAACTQASTCYEKGCDGEPVVVLLWRVMTNKFIGLFQYCIVFVARFFPALWIMLSRFATNYSVQILANQMAPSISSNQWSDNHQPIKWTFHYAGYKIIFLRKT